MNKTYQKFKEAGLCRRCGAEPAPGRTRCAKCHEKHLEYQKTHKEKALDAGLCRTCCKAKQVVDSTQCEECLALARERGVKQYQIWRLACIEAYGGECSCCGKTNPKYLQLDHIANDGAAHRKELVKQGRGGNTYKWAFKNGFPPILQLLCADCHQAKTFYGGCTEADHPLKT